MSSRTRFNRSTTGSRAPSASDAPRPPRPADQPRPASPLRRANPLGRAVPLRRALAVLWLVGAILAAGPALADRRVALVIGNSAYRALKPLQNPSNDAADVATSLKARGFEVITGSDLDARSMKDALARFSRRARDADVSLFYYAGHGFQVSSQNYLVPVDAIIRSREDVTRNTIDLKSILETLEGSRGLHLVFLDACRNNPLKGSGDATAEQLENGLARIGNAAGFLIAYATQPDNVAFDGGGRNSPFAQALLSHMNTRGQDINTMMISVRRDVLSATGGYQVPWENSSLTEQFFFTPGQALAVSPETQLWQLANTDNNPALVRIYLDRYPEGAHAIEARALMKGTQVASLDTGAVRSTPAGDPSADDRLWEIAQRSRMRSLVDYYLARNPTGRHAPDAKELLQSLPSLEAATPPVLCERAATHPRDATANTAGVPLAELAQNAGAAIEACQQARAANPEMPHYTALLARALAAAGRRDEAVRFYREAAERGNLRAMVSLGLLMETGDGVARDPKGAIALYEQAAARDFPDAAINLAVALFGGAGVPKDVGRAVSLLKRAADTGSAIATYNLGVLAQDGVTGDKASALALFRKATELGDARGFVPAAILLDEGRGVRKDPVAAGAMLLQGVASDSGEALAQLTGRSGSWSADTIREVQVRLKKEGYYKGVVDGRGGQKLEAPLRQWRRYGSLDPATRSVLLP